jgi:hypothetical protein
VNSQAVPQCLDSPGNAELLQPANFREFPLLFLSRNLGGVVKYYNMHKDAVQVDSAMNKFMTFIMQYYESESDARVCL